MSEEKTNVSGYEINLDKVVSGYRIWVYCTIPNNSGLLEVEEGIEDRQKAHEVFVAYVSWYGQAMYKRFGTRPTEEWRKDHKEW